MLNPRPELLLRRFRRLAAACPDTPGDAALLERFTRKRDEAAFTDLMWRHGPMVWQVCRRVLQDDHEAEDAFQATFLILAEKAATIRRQASVASWLYGVAYHLAIRVRSNGARRQQLAREATQPAEADPLEAVTARELMQLLDAEMHRLPERLRAPLVLCYLEGYTQEQAADHLGLGKATLRGRLERGRELLRRRLGRLGLPLAAALLPTALARTARAAMPAALAAATIRAALDFAGGAAPASPFVLTLMRGVGHTGFFSRLQQAVLFVLLVLLGAGTATLAYHGMTDPPADQAVAVAQDTPIATPNGGPAIERPASDGVGDPLPPGALARLGSVRLRHAGTVVGVAVAQGGQGVFSAGDDGRAVLWDVNTGREMRAYSPQVTAKDGRTLSAQSLALSPDGRTLAVSYYNRVDPVKAQMDRVWLFDVDTGKELGRLKGHHDDVFYLAFTADGKRLISGGQQDPLRVRDVPTGEERLKLDGAPKGLSRLALSSDGKTLATGGSDQIVRLWDAASGRLLHELPGHKGSIYTVAFAPDGRTLVSAAANDSLLHVWDVASGRTVRTLKANGPAAYSPDGRLLATGGGLRMILIWNAETGAELCRFAGHKHNVTALAFAPDGRTLVSGSHDGTVRLWDPATGKELSAARGHEDGINAVAYAPDCGMVATGGDDSSVRFWDPASGKQLRMHDRAEYDFVLPGKRIDRAHNGRSIFALAYLPGGKQLAVGGYQICQLADPVTGKRQVAFDMESDVNLSRLAVAPDGKTLAWSADGLVRLCDPATGKVRHRLPLHKAWVRALAFSPDGKQIATACADRTGLVRFWDVSTGKQIREIRSQNTEVVSLAFAPDGWTLAVGGSDAEIYRPETFVELWDLTGGREPRRLGGRHPSAGSLAFAPDGATLAVAAFTELHLWEVATGQRRGRFTHAGGINDLAFSPTGRDVVTAGRDSTALVWDLTGGSRQPAPLSEAQWRSAWADLGDADAVKAYRAMWTLAAAAQTVTALRERLRPLAPADGEQLVRWVEDLGADNFETRQRADAALVKQGRRAELALRQALAGGLALEARRRIELLLRQLPPPTSDEVRERRALEALGYSAAPEAAALLKALAAGSPADRLTESARQSLHARPRAMP